VSKSPQETWETWENQEIWETQETWETCIYICKIKLKILKNKYLYVKFFK
jgi:hypothetical protein